MVVSLVPVVPVLAATAAAVEEVAEEVAEEKEVVVGRAQEEPEQPQEGLGRTAGARAT